MCMSSNSACLIDLQSGKIKKSPPLCPPSKTLMTLTWNTNLWSTPTWNHIEKGIPTVTRNSNPNLEPYRDENSMICSFNLEKLIQHKSHYQFILLLIRKLKTEKESNLRSHRKSVGEDWQGPGPILFYFCPSGLLVTAKILRACPSACPLDLQTEGSRG